jgi:hypothetical protein
MTAVAGGLLALTLLIALADWVAVAVDRRPLEYVLKPATMVALGAVVLALDLPGGQLRWWYLAAIVSCPWPAMCSSCCPNPPWTPSCRSSPGLDRSWWPMCCTSSAWCCSACPAAGS